jgi:hypothetical protein
MRRYVTINDGEIWAMSDKYFKRIYSIIEKIDEEYNSDPENYNRIEKVEMLIDAIKNSRMTTFVGTVDLDFRI